MGELVTVIFDAIVGIVSGFGLVFVDLFANITQIFFYEDAGNIMLTEVGTLSLIVFGIGLVWTGIRWLSRLIKLRG